MDNFKVISYGQYGDFSMKVLVVLLTLASAGMAIEDPLDFGLSPEFGNRQVSTNTYIIEFCKGQDCGDNGECTGPNCLAWNCAEDNPYEQGDAVYENCDRNAWYIHCAESTDCHPKTELTITEYCDEGFC